MAEGSSGSSSSPGADAGIKSRGVSDSDAGPSAEALEAVHKNNFPFRKKKKSRFARYCSNYEVCFVNQKTDTDYL